MTARAFRTLALSLLEATEGSHMGHADFRVRGKIFASLGPKEDWAMAPGSISGWPPGVDLFQDLNLPS